MKKVLCILLAIVLIASVMVGCNNDPNSFDYEKYLKEQAKLQEKIEKQMLDFWYYGNHWIHPIERYNSIMRMELGEPEKQYRITEIDAENEEQYRTKLQAALMAGEGPDLIYTGDPYLFTNVDKSIEAGAFLAWDPYIKDWPLDEYYTQMMDGYRSTDGKIYLLPLVCTPHLYITTKSNLEKYDLSEASFSDYQTTLDTMLYLDETISAESDIMISGSIPPFYPGFVDIFDLNDTRSLSDPYLQDCLAKIDRLLDSERLQIDNELQSALPKLINGDYIFLSADLDRLAWNCGVLTEEEQKELVLIPMNDANGRMSGNIQYYAMIPRNCKNPKVAADTIHQIYSDRGTAPEGTVMLNHQEQDFIYLTVYPNVTDPLKEQIDLLLEHPMNLFFYNLTNLDYSNRVMNAFGDSDKWQELERSINIYLSE